MVTVTQLRLLGWLPLPDSRQEPETQQRGSRQPLQETQTLPQPWASVPP